MDARFTQASALARKHAPGMVVELVANFLLPLLIYDAMKARYGDVDALIASSAPPILWSLVEFIRARRIDALSLLVLAGIVLSGLAYLGGGSVKLLQLRERLVTAIIGLAFLVSAAIGRPLIYQLARAQMVRRGSPELAEFDARREHPLFRRTMTVMTLVWGFALVAEAGLAALLVMRLSVHDYLLVSPVVSYAAMGGLGLWTFWYARRQRRRGAAMRAAAASAGQQASGL